jgi:CRISPR/Cas system-associated exonuclease Cas4 (RecB family)
MMTTYMSCPLQAKFREIIKLPYQQNAKASFGSIIHKCLDEYNHTGDIDTALSNFKKWWHEPELLGVAPDYWPKFTTYSSLRTRGIEILEEYHKKNKWETRKVVATEHRFCVPFGEHELSGIVDLLEVKKDGKGQKVLNVIDYKTNSTAPSKTNLRLNIQFTTYVYAAMQPEFWFGNGEDKYPPIPEADKWFSSLQDAKRRGVWYHLWTNKAIDAGDRDDEDFMRLYRCCVEIEKAIKNDVYVPNISGESCTFCDYIEPCGLPINPRTYDPDKE